MTTRRQLAERRGAFASVHAYSLLLPWRDRLEARSWRAFAAWSVVAAIFLQRFGGLGGATFAAEEAAIESTPLTTQVSIAKAMDDEFADTASPVSLRGVITLRDGEGLVIQDATGGIWVDIHNALREGVLKTEAAIIEHLAAPDEIEVVGSIHAGGFAPNIVPQEIRVVGQGVLPRPRSSDSARFFQGADDCLLVQVTGIVQGYTTETDRHLLSVAHGTQLFVAEVFSDVLANPQHLIDQEVLFTGVAIARFNNRGESLWIRLLVGSAGAVSMITPRLPSSRAAPFVPLDSIARFSRELSDGHRIRTKGVVTRASPCDYAYLQEGTQGVRVETTGCEIFQPGDVVEALGFVRRGDVVARIVEADITKIGSGPPPLPLSVTPEQIVAVNSVAATTYRRASPGDFIGALVCFDAELLDTQATRYGAELVLATGGVPTSALLDAKTFNELRSLAAGSQIRVTGIVQPWASSAEPDPLGVLQALSDQRLRVLIRSKDDIRVVRHASWWTARRWATALGILAILAASAFGWVVSLKRQVRRQYRIIESTLKAEATVAERQRIAREFHDTLEQDLAAVGMRLDRESHRAPDSATQRALEEQRRVVSRIQADAHDFLWDLRDATRNDGSLMLSLERQIAYLRSLHGEEMILEGPSTPIKVSSMVQYHVLRIVREAIHNAAQHAGASHITVSCAHDGTTLTVHVADDGRGFSEESARSREGHFGLRGMSERATRLGGSLSIGSRDGMGTVVTLTCPSTLS